MSLKKERFQTKPPKYVPSIHLPLLDEIFSKGKSIASFCVAAKIVRTTFHNWVEQYPDFEEAYELATSKAQVYWEEYGANNMMIPGFNYSWWASIMRNRFGYTEHRKIKIKGIDQAKTAMDKYNLVLKEVSEGQITAHELKQLVESILAGTKILEHTELCADVKELQERVKEQQTENN